MEGLHVKGFGHLLLWAPGVRLEDVPECLQAFRRGGRRAVRGALQAMAQGPNIITNYGHSLIASRLTGVGITALGTSYYLAVGTGGGTPTTGDTAMFNEPGSGTFRKIVTTATVSANVIQLSCNFSGSEAVGSLTEMGLFDAASSGNMFNHWVPTPATPFPHSSGTMTALLEIDC